MTNRYIGNKKYRYIVNKNYVVAFYQPYQVYHSYHRDIIARFKQKKDAVEFAKKKNKELK